MKSITCLRFMISLFAVIALVTVLSAGGGILVTVKDFPEYAVAAKPITLAFKVWVPSLEPVRALKSTVRATNAAGHIVKAAARARGTHGDFTATLRLDEPGDWVIAFDTEYEAAVTMPPLRVISPEAPQPSPMSPATLGLRLFTVKGCNGCHLHPDVPNGRFYGPDLTGKLFPAEYLRRFLADPSITPVPDNICNKNSSICGSPYGMPNLDLKKSEIEALVAFLTKR
jgi:hypothetical protein